MSHQRAASFDSNLAIGSQLVQQSGNLNRKQIVQIKWPGFQILINREYTLINTSIVVSIHWELYHELSDAASQ